MSVSDCGVGRHYCSTAQCFIAKCPTLLFLLSFQSAVILTETFKKGKMIACHMQEHWPVGVCLPTLGFCLWFPAVQCVKPFDSYEMAPFHFAIFVLHLLIHANRFLKGHFTQKNANCHHTLSSRSIKDFVHIKKDTGAQTALDPIHFHFMDNCFFVAVVFWVLSTKTKI